MVEIASKRIPVTEGVWESLSTLKKPGQTYDDLLEELIAIRQERDFLAHLDEIEKTDEFISLSEAAKELNIKEV